MRKTIVVIALAVIAGLVVADLAEGEEKNTTPVTTETTEKPYKAPTTTTTVEDNSAEIAQCASDFLEYSEALTELSELGQYVVTEADARAFLSASREAVDAGRRGVAKCGEYLPASDVAAFEALLDELEANLDTLDALL